MTRASRGVGMWGEVRKLVSVWQRERMVGSRARGLAVAMII